MKRRSILRRAGVCAALTFGLLCLSTRAEAQSSTISKVQVSPVGPQGEGPEGEIGNVIAEFTDGHHAQLTQNGLAALPILASDGRTVAFLTVEWGTYHGDKVPFFPKILVFRDDRKLATLKPEYIAEIDDLQFGNGWKQLAVASSGMHGPTRLQLFDIASGRVVASAWGPDKPRPAWAKELLSR
jgi:hypothetical protein